MRVGVLTTSYPRHADDWAGGFVAELARCLARAGDAIEVLAPFPAAEGTPGIRLRALRYACRPRLCYGAGVPDNLFGAARRRPQAAVWAQVPAYLALAAAATWWHSRRWDAVVSHWLLPSGLVAARLARGRPHLAIAHSSDVHFLRRLPGGAVVLRALARPRSALVLTSATLRAPLLEVARDDSSRRWVERAPVMPMGVRAPPWVAAERRALPPRRNRSALRVLFVGRLIALKGVDVLLRACAAGPFALRVVGDGPERSVLERLAATLGVAVEFLGPLGVEAKWRALLAAEVLVLPSRVLADGRTDSAPVTVIEALTAGTAVVASAVGGVPALLAAGPCGLLVPPDDPPALRAALQRLHEDAALSERLVAAGRQRARAFAWESVGARYRALLAAL
ncbi:MAG: glycosyltransferase family 4 protein [Proteobacteria bacterium]|nr:glycosyltransferase family 4 protein [Pseudomonadota bacterium]